MSDYKKKIRQARLIAAKKPPVERAITNVVSKDELQELYMQFNSIYDQVRISLAALEKNTTESNKQTAEKMVEINNTVVDVMGKVLDKGLSIDNVEDIKKAIESSGVKITNIDDLKQTVKVELPEGDNKLEEVSKNLANIADQLGSIEPAKQGQRPEDFVPFRRVIRTGKRLEFDDTSWSGARGGGGSSGGGIDTSTLATSAKQDDIIDLLSPSANDVIMREKSTDSDIIYIGEAANGSATSGSVWKITRLDLNTLLDVTYADGNLNYDNVWDNRESLSYS